MSIRNRIRSVVAMAAALVMVLAGTALADYVTNDITLVDGQRTKTLDLATASSVSGAFKLHQENDPDNHSGNCNVASDRAATFAFDSTPSGVTASNVTFTTCTGSASTQSTSFSAPVGTYDVTLRQTTSVGGITTTAASFRLVVTDSSAPVGVAPSLNPALTPSSPDGDNQWYKSNVSINWNIAGDPQPTVDSGCETGPFTADGTYNKSCTVSNGVGSPAADSVQFKIDKTPPSVNVTGVASATQYLLGSVPTAACETTDATSGVATHAVLASTPDNTTVGEKSVQCTGAKDHAGNTARSSVVNYSVVYDATGILQPINSDGSSRFRLNSTIPVKIKLTGDSAGVSNAVITQSVSKLTNNVWGSEDEGTSTATPHSGNQLRYDASSDQYIFNLATKPLGTGTFRITLNLGGGKTETAQFSIVR